MQVQEVGNIQLSQLGQITLSATLQRGLGSRRRLAPGPLTITEASAPAAPARRQRRPNHNAHRIEMTGESMRRQTSAEAA